MLACVDRLLFTGQRARSKNGFVSMDANATRAHSAVSGHSHFDLTDEEMQIEKRCAKSRNAAASG
jgi:hypothetical protein